MSCDVPYRVAGLLPPNVNGKCSRGALSLHIKSIKFCDPKFNFNSYNLKILFWGQRTTEALQIRYEAKPTTTTAWQTELTKVEYDIRTSSSLFKSYLKNCEPIVIQFSSTKTNLHVGKAQIPIASKFINSNDQAEQTARHQIISPKGHYLGDLILQIVLLLNPSKKKMTTVATSPQPPPPFSKSTHPTPEKASKTQLEAVPVDDQKQQKIIAYLRGDEMTAKGEKDILNEICSISPAQSLMNLLEAEKNAKPAVAMQPKSPNFLLKHVDSIRVTVKRLELTKAGVKEVLHRCTSQSDANLCAFDFIIDGKVWSGGCVESMQFSAALKSGWTVDFNRQVIKTVQPNPTGSIAFKIFFRDTREFCQSRMNGIGDARLQIGEAINGSFSCIKMCPVMLSNDSIVVGHLIVRLELGARGLHFGEEFFDAVLCNKENTTINERDIYFEASKFHRKSTSCLRPSIENRYCFGKRCCNNPCCDGGASEAPQKPLHPDISQAAAAQVMGGNSATINNDDHRSTTRPPLTEAKGDEAFLQLRGILYINCVRNVRVLTSGGYFFVCKDFWGDDITTTEMGQNEVFNFLKTFSVVCNEQFLTRVCNNHLDLAMHSMPDHLVGVARLPLHQFYIAFRDAALAARLRETCKLPVISCDGWCNVVSPVSGELCGQVNALLAIGTEEQLEFLKASRGLTGGRPVSHTNGLSGPSRTVDLLASLNGEQKMVPPVSNTADMLSSFIENLAQNLPNRTKAPAAALSCGVPPNLAPQMKKTSDLLESLQRALSTQKSPTSAAPSESVASEMVKPTRDTGSGPEEETFRAIVDVEAAMHLPKVSASKKYAKARNKAKQQKVETEPSAYVTFEATLSAETATTSLFKSHEGMVYATNVVERDCNPVWKRRFDVVLPVDLIRNKEKQFVLKVWRKPQADGVKLVPTPMEDAIIGFAAIDLTVLLTGMSPLSGWFNIVDFSGRCNGQLQVHIRPIDDATQFRRPSQQSPTLDAMIPLSIDIDGDLSLSRALKRKFIELEEITQRLKARLFDVTGDEEVDPDEEFERDLNTVAMEDEDFNATPANVASTSADFGWLGAHKDPFHVESNEFQELLMKSLNRQQTVDPATPNTSTSIPSERPTVSGCSSNRELHDNFDSLLRKHDIDTLLNPNLFKNLLDPLASASSDTSSLIQKPVPGVSSSSEASLTSADTSGRESIQFIENALQNAALVETETSSRSSGCGDGQSGGG